MRHDIQTRLLAVAVVAGALLTGCSSSREKVSLEVRLVEPMPSGKLTEMRMKVWGRELKYYAHDKVLLTEKDVAAADVIMKGGPAIELTLVDAARAKLRRIARRKGNCHIGIIINGQLQSVSAINEPVTTGIVTVTGHMLPRAAQRCSRALTPEVARKRNTPLDTA